MNEVLSELLRVLARDWKTLKDGMLDYHLMKAADMADELERDRDEARKQLRVAVGLLSTTPKFQDQHPEEVLKFVEEAAK